MDVNKLAEDMRIEAGQETKVRERLTQVSIRGDYNGGEFDMVLKSKPGTANGVEVRWHGHIDLSDYQRKKGEYWVWEYSTLRKREIRQLIKWLTRIEKALS